MKNLFIAVMILFTASTIEAEQKNLRDGIDVYAIHSNTYNSTESRSETISADITGHTLTITFNDNSEGDNNTHLG